MYLVYTALHMHHHNCQHSVFERFRSILHEGVIDKRVQFIIEGLFAIRKASFGEHVAIKPELDLVEAEDQITHELGLDDSPEPQTGLDIFKASAEAFKALLHGYRPLLDLHACFSCFHCPLSLPRLERLTAHGPAGLDHL